MPSKRKFLLFLCSVHSGAHASVGKLNFEIVERFPELEVFPSFLFLPQELCGVSLMSPVLRSSATSEMICDGKSWLCDVNRNAH